MDFGQEKNKGFFQQRTEKIVTEVEKTPLEKFFVFFLVLISISALVLGFMQFRKDIEGPALSSYLERKRGELMDKYAPSATTATAELTNRLKNQDSDLDGLDDWSEINIYHTNPYLADTDNDGIPDKQEILQGTDPNCPKGMDCSAIVLTLPVAGSEGTNTNLNSIINTLGEADLQTIMQYEQDLLAGKVTLEQLGINNPELQNLFDQMKNVPASQGANLNSEEKTQAVTDLKKMTPAQLRAELLKRGMDKATLDQIDDQTLLQMLDQLIATYK